ncbi:uncharacterized protein ANIA_11292 [Aspergillus nidulans FGSC A4]|uniref:Uncharacterized protein n=1 Tax=Emericella nidulans (strain FGSC A4 / ATCC 38163 / CBS 112.46 / NRRL 194 / M139) TaxID=227321 RepID=C8VTN6_EMENI|nr:hypothetical protein [Aspergillus nidulans FGSC A4]CBF88213.1 TPA: hypothetical protein ANIA_11292 [Aspergillus nidulans FGSC A4]
MQALCRKYSGQREATQRVGPLGWDWGRGWGSYMPRAQTEDGCRELVQLFSSIRCVALDIQDCKHVASTFGAHAFEPSSR